MVCNTSFTDLSDSRVKTEIAEADVAELKQLFDSVEAKQYKRPDMNGDLRLGFASDDFAGTKCKNLTGTRRWSDGTEMVTLDYSHLTSVLGGVQGLPGPAGRGGSLAGPTKAEEQVKNGGAEGPGRRLQRAGSAEAVPTREAARPRRDAGHGLRGAEGRRGPPRPRALGKSAAEGPNDGCRPTSLTSARTRGAATSTGWSSWTSTREAAVETLQTKNAKAVGKATKRAVKELTGDDKNFVVTTDLGNKFATLDRELPAEAVHRTKRPEDRKRAG